MRWLKRHGISDRIPKWEAHIAFWDWVARTVLFLGAIAVGWWAAARSYAEGVIAPYGTLGYVMAALAVALLLGSVFAVVAWGFSRLRLRTESTNVPLHSPAGATEPSQLAMWAGDGSSEAADPAAPHASYQEMVKQLATEIERLQKIAAHNCEKRKDIECDLACALDTMTMLAGYLAATELLGRMPQVKPIVENGSITSRNLGEQRMVADDYIAQVMIALRGTQWHDELARKMQQAIQEADRYIGQMSDAEIPPGMDRTDMRSYIAPITQCNRIIEFLAQEKKDRRETLGSLLSQLEAQAARRRQTPT